MRAYDNACFSPVVPERAKCADISASWTLWDVDAYMLQLTEGIGLQTGEHRATFWDRSFEPAGKDL